MSKNNDSNFDFDMGTIGALIALFVVPPVGIVLLVNRLRKFGRSKKRAKEMRNMGISAMVVGAVAAVLGFPGYGAFTAVCGAVMSAMGQGDQKKSERYRRYLSVIGGRSPISLTEIAAKTNQSVNTVERDLQDMIDAGYFGLDTFIDRSRMCLVLDGVDDYNWSQAARNTTGNGVHINVEDFVKKASDIFHDVEDAVNTARTTYNGRTVQQKQTQQAAQPAKTTARPQPEKAQTAEKTEPAKEQPAGDQFGRTISQIRELNDRIADPDISAKIDQIEAITSRIFSVVRKKPERIGEIRKFMNYYLPTTLKLLDSYAMLEEQGIEGDNITASKQQISAILDTLIASYKKQLDLLFANQAMDISTDIEVMENMLAADGLKESDFKINRPMGGH